MTDLKRFRAEIDALDDQIVDLLGRRFAIGREVAAYKLARNIPVYLNDRIEEVRNRNISRGIEHSIRPEFMAALYDLIIEETCATEIREQAKLPASSSDSCP
jgi:chorismate mutase